MPIGEQLFQSTGNQPRRHCPTQKTQRWFVVYLIPEYRSFRVRVNGVTVTPAPKGPTNLHVLEQVWWLVESMLRNPAHRDWSKDFGFNYCLTANIRNPRRLNYAGAFPGWNQ